MASQEHAPRRIVLILGNGFDLDLGLKTSYRDFWVSEFCPKNYPAPLIHHLNQQWPDSLESVKWYDLENELLNYYKSIPDPKTPADFLTEEERVFMKDFEPYRWGYGIYNDQIDLVEALVDKRVILYNEKQFLCPLSAPDKGDIAQSPSWRDHKAFRLIKDGLCAYLKTVCDDKTIDRNSVALNVLFAMNCARLAGADLKIYNFNYTQMPESFGNEIRYVHGNCETGKIIIGTRDDGIFDRNYDYLQKSLDPSYYPPSIVPDLSDADEVVIFGHSLGENDRQYFKAFFKQQADFASQRRKDIIIFTWDEKSEIDIRRPLQKMTDYNLSTLLSQNHIEIIRTSKVREEANRLQAFFSNHISDVNQLRVTMSQLIEGRE